MFWVKTRVTGRVLATLAPSIGACFQANVACAAADANWMFSCAAFQGAIINGCIRDSEDIGKMPLGVKALNTYPLKSSKRDLGLRDVPVSFAGATIKPGDWVYADKDGILVSETELKL
jgi:RraA family protein